MPSLSRMTFMIIDIKNRNSLQNAAEVLKTGGVLIFPTDTVYGIGCLMIDEAIEKLYQIKNRPATQPTAVLMSRNIFDGKRVKELVLDEYDEDFMTGKMTIIDSVSNYAIDFPKMILSDSNKIGIRLPQYAWLTKLIDEVGPIVTSSANKKGEPAPANFQEISELIKKEADLIIESHDLISGHSSKIYNLESGKIIR